MPVEQIGLDEYVKRYEGDTAIRNIPPNEAATPDYNNYRTAPYERELVQEQDRWTDPKLFTPEQKRTYERSFQNNPDWRLLKGHDNSWMYAPGEPESEQYRQGKNAMEELTGNVERMVTPDTGTYNPDYVPMRGGNGLRGEGPVRFEQRHFDPARSQDTNMAQFPPPPPIPGQLPTPPGTGGYGPVGQMVSSAFSPAPPGTDPMSFQPTDLLRQLREGFISDEDVAQIERDPKSWASLAAYGLTAANAAINISRGAGRGERLNWHIAPLEEWNAMKTPKGMHPAYKADEAGNLYQAQGTHDVANPDGTNTSHIIVKEVGHNHPMTPEHEAELKAAPPPKPGSKEWFEKNDQAIKNILEGKPPPDPNLLKYWKDWEAATGQKRPPEAPQDPVTEGWPEKAKKGWTGKTPSEAEMKSWDQMTPKEKADFLKKVDEEAKKPHPTPPPKAQEAIDKIEEHFDSINDPANYWKLYQQGKLPGQKGPPEQGPPSPGGKPDIGGFKPPPGEEGPNLLVPGEEVGPVDWGWYEPVGGKNPPYEPPFEVPPGWAPEDMGAHPAEFWDRFSWEPPPDPNSPDFPGPNRWDYLPPPDL